MLVALMIAASTAAAGATAPPPEPPPVPPPVAVPAPPPIVATMRPLPTSGTPPLLIPKGTRAMIEVDDMLSSDQSQPGSRFKLRLADDLMIDGWPVLSAGASGEGEVVHAAKAGWGGKAGELIVNARFLTCGAVQLPLGKMRLGGRGENRLGTAWAATMVFSPAGFLVSGGNLSVPRGTRAEAAILADIPISSIAGTPCAATQNVSTPAAK